MQHERILARFISPVSAFSSIYSYPAKIKVIASFRFAESAALTTAPFRFLSRLPHGRSRKKVNVTHWCGLDVCVAGVGNIPPIDDFPGLCLEDSPLGVRFVDFATVFPAAINAAST